PHHRSFFVLCQLCADPVGWRHGRRLCLRQAAAPNRPSQIHADAWHLCNAVVRRAASHQSLRKWNRRAADEISAFRWPMERAADVLTNRDLVLQRAQVSAVSRLSAHHTRAVAHLARIARRYSGQPRSAAHSAGVWPGAAFLLLAASLSAERHGSIGRVGLLPADLSWNRHRRLCAETSRLWSWSAIPLRHVDSRRDDSLICLPLVF